MVVIVITTVSQWVLVVCVQKVESGNIQIKGLVCKEFSPFFQKDC